MSFARLCVAAQRAMSTATPAAPGGTTAVQKLPRPKMKNFFRDELVNTFYGALPVSVLFGLIFYVKQVKKRAKIYDDYYRAYTPEKQIEDFERMRQLGVFHSAPADGKEMEAYSYLE